MAHLLALVRQIDHFHEFLHSKLTTAMYESIPGSCAYCHQPEDCETHLSAAVRYYAHHGGLRRDIQKHYSQQLTSDIRALLRKQREIKSVCPKYKGPDVFAYYTVAVNISCSDSKEQELVDFARHLQEANVIIPIGTPIVYLEFDVRPINNVWQNVLEDVSWIPYSRWKCLADFHTFNQKLLTITDKLWQKAVSAHTSQPLAICSY